MIQSRSESNPPLENNFSLEELQCYNLPFGALGFTSHILTYYTILCLWYGKRPLWPLHPINSRKSDLVLNVVGLAVCIVMSAITIFHCKNTWQLLLIAVWKLSMSVLNGLTGVHVAMLKSTDGMPMKTKQTAWWLVLCE